MENLAYSALMEARESLNQEWPEPQTSQFHTVLRQSALAIVGSVLGRKEPELASEIATKALLGLSKFKGQSLFSTWFYRLSRNAALSHIRDSHKDVSLESLLEEPVSRPTGSSDCLKALTAPERQLAELVLAGHTHREIGLKLGVSHVTAGKQWQKLCAKLKFLLKCSETS